MACAARSVSGLTLGLSTRSSVDSSACGDSDAAASKSGIDVARVKSFVSIRIPYRRAVARSRSGSIPTRERVFFDQRTRRADVGPDVHELPATGPRGGW